MSTWSRSLMNELTELGCDGSCDGMASGSEGGELFGKPEAPRHDMVPVMIWADGLL